jgi:hypothetical protein
MQMQIRIQIQTHGQIDTQIHGGAQVYARARD